MKILQTLLKLRLSPSLSYWAKAHSLSLLSILSLLSLLSPIYLRMHVSIKSHFFISLTLAVFGFSLSRSSSSHGIRADEKRDLGFACDAFPCAALPCVAALPAGDLSPCRLATSCDEVALRSFSTSPCRPASGDPSPCRPVASAMYCDEIALPPCRPDEIYLPAAPVIRLPRRDLFFGNPPFADTNVDALPADALTLTSSPRRSVFCRRQQPTPC